MYTGIKGAGVSLLQFSHITGGAFLVVVTGMFLIDLVAPCYLFNVRQMEKRKWCQIRTLGKSTSGCLHARFRDTGRRYSKRWHVGKEATKYAKGAWHCVHNSLKYKLSVIALGAPVQAFSRPFQTRGRTSLGMFTANLPATQESVDLYVIHGRVHRNVWHRAWELTAFCIRRND